MPDRPNEPARSEGAHAAASNRESHSDRICRVVWSDAQVVVLNRAERLRYYGAGRQAARLVANECQLPTELRLPGDLALPLQLDIARWYAAFKGEPWDGTAVRLQRARDLARSTRGPLQPVDRPGTRAFRSSHLLVEPLQSHPNAHELRDYTRLVGWPRVSDVGFLQWDDPSGLACAFCDALLLHAETERIPGADGVVKGKHCCANGCARRAAICYRVTCCPPVFAGVLMVGCDVRVAYAGKFIRRPCRSFRCGCGNCGWVSQVGITERPD